ncbi:NAD(P)-binding protein [Hypoxylon sp. FL0890]|nr:NAD(P)-binding protein [Hypoxylon sp. FL0890]
MLITSLAPHHLSALGIGFEVSPALAHAGCKVIMVNRKEEQGVSAIETMKKETPNAQVDWKECDMGHLKQIQEMFSKLRQELDSVDFVVCAAGINTNQYELDADNIDRHFGTAQRSDTPAPRIVFESSEVHRMAPNVVHFGSIEEINNPSLGPTELYGRTKLAMILLAKYGLAGKAIKQTGDRIYAIAVHPGAVNTAVQQQWKDAYPGITGQLLSYAMLGHYFHDPGEPGKESAQASDSLLGAALWDLSHRLVEMKLGNDALIDWNAKWEA